MDNIIIKRMKKEYMKELLSEIKHITYTHIEDEKDEYNLEIYSVISVAMKLLKKASNKQIKEAYNLDSRRHLTRNKCKTRQIKVWTVF